MDAIVVGIDGSKDKLDIALLPQGETYRAPRCEGAHKPHRTHKAALDGMSHGEPRDVQARIFPAGAPSAGTVFNGST